MSDLFSLAEEFEDRALELPLTTTAQGYLKGSISSAWQMA